MKIKLTFVIVAIFLIDCSNTASTEPEETVEGFYFLHGEKIEIKYKFPWPSIGGEEIIISRDTVETSFTVEIKLVGSRVDTIQFFGLHGVNAGSRGILPGNCEEFTPDYCAFASLIDSDLDIELLSPSGEYTANGTLENGQISLDAHFEYRSDGISYSLKGVKVEP